MGIIFYIIQKEFIQIFRNKTMLPMIFLMPLIQMFILVYTATLEMRHINMFVVDKDLSQTSRQLISKFEGSPFYFRGLLKINKLNTSNIHTKDQT